MGRKDEGSSKNCLCRGKVGEFMGGGPEGKEEPREVGNPVRGSTTGCEGSFEAAVDSFNHAIGLGMKSSGVDVGNLKKI